MGILALLSACDKAEEQPAPEVPAVPLTVLTPTSTVLFQVFGSKDDPRILPLAVSDGGHLAPLVLDADGWRLLDSLFFAKGRKLSIYRNGSDQGTIEVTRGMWNDEGSLYTLPGCTDLMPQGAGRFQAKGAVEQSVEYLASSTPLTQPREERRVPRDAEAKGRSFGSTVAASRELGSEELAHLEFIARWLPTGAGSSGLTLMASYVDPNAGDAGAGVGHSVMILALAEDSAGTLLSSYQHVSSGDAKEVRFQRVLNHADLDGDGVDEILVDESTFGGGSEFMILKHAQGRWRGVFRISQNWCLDKRERR